MKTFRGGGKAIEVLLVEDSPGDVRLTQEAFRDAKWRDPPARFGRRRGGYGLPPAQRPPPSSTSSGLILLDLNLPKMDGREVLAHIKEDSILKTIPTVMLSTSKAEVDVVKSYQLHANFYLTKPVQLEDFEALVKSINDSWRTKIEVLPKG